MHYLHKLAYDATKHPKYNSLISRENGHSTLILSYDFEMELKEKLSCYSYLP